MHCFAHLVQRILAPVFLASVLKGIVMRFHRMAPDSFPGSQWVVGLSRQFLLGADRLVFDDLSSVLDIDAEQRLWRALAEKTGHHLIAVHRLRLLQPVLFTHEFSISCTIEVTCLSCAPPA